MTRYDAIEQECRVATRIIAPPAYDIWEMEDYPTAKLRVSADRLDKSDDPEHRRQAVAIRDKLSRERRPPTRGVLRYAAGLGLVIVVALLAAGQATDLMTEINRAALGAGE